MTTHISVAHMLPTSPSLSPSTTPPSSSCLAPLVAAAESTLFINSFLMLPDGMTVIYGGPSVFTFMCAPKYAHQGVFIHRLYAY